MINSKQKGKRGELEIVSILRSHGYVNARRSQQYCGKHGDADIVDALPGVHIEVKRTERLSIYDAIDQAKRDAAPGEMPVVMYKKNNHRWLVIMELEPGFMEMYRECEGSVEQ